MFCDVVGSTTLGERLDPEALSGVLTRFGAEIERVAERHGGQPGHLMGDGVMSVFGVPAAHEDDALRAVRAAAEMAPAVERLNERLRAELDVVLAVRIGVNTGEVVASGRSPVLGDAINVAARLEQAASPGEVLLGAETLRLVRGAVDVEPVEPLSLKGKSEPVAAFRLVAVTGENARRHAAPMVGRATEVRRLRDAYEQAERNRSCQLFTVLGNAGVGKSRLAYEFLRDLDLTVARGRCLSYGEGITYWPVVEVLEQLPEVELDPSVRQALASVLGEEAVVTSSAEIAWAFRKLLEAAARRAARRRLRRPALGRGDVS